MTEREAFEDHCERMGDIASASAWSAWQAACAWQRERDAAIAAPERIPYSDEEWRVRCEIRDAIRKGTT